MLIELSVVSCLYYFWMLISLTSFYNTLHNTHLQTCVFPIRFWRSSIYEDLRNALKFYLRLHMLMRLQSKETITFESKMYFSITPAYPQL